MKFAAWVLAHEIGHHDTSDQYNLFSPFLFSTLKNKKHKKSEELANETALFLLTTPQDWINAEKKHPCSLKAITDALELPVEAGKTWSNLQRKSEDYKKVIQIYLTDETWFDIQSKMKGSGGIQHTLNKLYNSRSEKNTLLTRSDFILIRMRAAILKGGWALPFQKIMYDIEPQILSAGNVDLFFNET